MIHNISLTNDAKIIACARHYASVNPEDEIVFVTNDLCCKTNASLYFTVESVNEDDYDYEGYKEVFLNESEMSDFYSNYTENKFNLFPNEYLLVYSYETGEHFWLARENVGDVRACETCRRSV